MKTIKIIIILILFSIKLFGQIPSCIKISSQKNKEQITFTLPKYQIIDTNLLALFNNDKTYKYIKINNEFGVISDVGRPEIPQISFDIAIPADAHNLKIILSNTKYKNISIDKKIMPTQEYFEHEKNPKFIIDNNYYSTKGESYNFNYKISENYCVFGQKGITITIFPFLYKPKQNKLNVLQEGTFTFSYSSNKQTKNKNVNKDYSTQSYLSKFFINYKNDKTEKVNYGRYLIITSPVFESTLTYFANYKRNIGYEVVVVNTNTTGTSAEDVQDYLQNQYDNTSTRPTFVLLVGDVTDIAASGGSTSSSNLFEHQLDDYKDPLTDLNYSLLDGDDYYADIFLGRWSVSIPEFGPNQLQNIIYKTIIMETNIHTYNKQAVFLAGSNNIGLLENQYASNLDWIIDNTFEPDNWICNKLYAIDGATETDGLNALNDDNQYFIYRGHGDYLTNEEPFKIGVGDIMNQTISNTVYPMVFSLSCLTNCFGYLPSSDQPCLGEAWIRSEHGGISFFGATTVTKTYTNGRIIKKIFDEETFNEEQLVPMINLGMKNYKNAFWTMNGVKVIRHMKTYNFLGDPSFIKTGIGCIDNIVFNNEEVFHSGDIITYQASNTIENNNTFEVQSGSNVTLIADKSVRLSQGFHAEAGSNFHAYNAACQNKTENNNNTTENNQIQRDTTIVEKEASVFPNPFTNYILFCYYLETTDKVTISIYNISGIKVFEQTTIENKGIIYQSINTFDFRAGTYIYQIQTKNTLYKGTIIKIN